MKTPEVPLLSIIGAQWGDEGKSKIVSHYAPYYDIIARAAGGPNAGHTIHMNGNQYKFHGLPESGLWPGKLGVIGPGALVDPIKLGEEIKKYNVADSDLAISHNAFLITPVHVRKDEIREASAGRQGTTKVGIAFAAADKAQRIGVPLCLVEERAQEIHDSIVEDLSNLESQLTELDLELRDPIEEAEAWLESARALGKYARDTTILIYDALMSEKTILVSGAQSHNLDLNEQPYPYGTSTHTVSGGISTGLPVAPWALAHVTGVIKLFKSRVGDGPFVTEIIDDDLANNIRGELGQPGAEWGTTSERARRVGYLDLPEVKRAIIGSGITEIATTKLDQLPRFGRSILVATSYNMPGRDEPVYIAPNVASELAQAEPVYEEFGLWSEDDNNRVSGAKSWIDLPYAAKRLLGFIEQQLEIEIRLIGTGVDQEQIIVR